MNIAAGRYKSNAIANSARLGGGGGGEPITGHAGGSGGAGARDELRRAVVGVLDQLGVEHPLARESRRKLAAALY